MVGPLSLSDQAEAGRGMGGAWYGRGGLRWGGDSWMAAESDWDKLVCGRGQEYFYLVKGVAGRRDQAQVGGISVVLGLKPSLVSLKFLSLRARPGASSLVS